MADQLGYLALGSAQHISFGHLNVDGRKMKSREGKVVLLDSLLDEVTEVALDGLHKRRTEDNNTPVLEDDLEVAKMIGVGSIIFNDLRHDREKDIEFTPDAARALESGGSIYVQYTNSRINSIIERIPGNGELTVVPSKLAPEERKLLMQIARFPVIISEAAESSNPHKLATYLTDFCKAVNDFYHGQPIMRADSDEQRTFRINLIKATQQVIANSARIVQIELPERM